MAHLSYQRAVVSIGVRLAVGTKAAPGVGMQNSQSSPVLEHAIAVVELARPLVEAIQRRDRDLASQLRRAISSIALNISEGLGNSAGNSRLRFETARGSLKEAQAGIRVAVAWGYIPQSAAEELLASMHVLGGRVFGLCRR